MLGRSTLADEVEEVVSSSPGDLSWLAVAASKSARRSLSLGVQLTRMVCLGTKGRRFLDVAHGPDQEFGVFDLVESVEGLAEVD